MKMMLPEGFLQLMKSYGSPDLEGLEKALSGEPTVCVRRNSRKAGNWLPEGERVKWWDEGFYPGERPKFTLDPRMHQGLYYVQDASSMIIGHIVRELLKREGDNANGLKVLDACAAPGGKTGVLSDVLPEDSVIVANEYTPQRVHALRENVAKWGNGRVRVTSMDAKDFGRYGGLFDLILADAPCSGEGMMRKEVVAAEQWSEKLIEECAARQRDITRGVWKSLKPGGYLIYSTCTFNRKENEEVGEWIRDELGGESVEIAVDEEWGVSGGINTDISCLRFIPGKTRGEGLFVAVFRKPSVEMNGREKMKKHRKSEKNRRGEDEVRGWLSEDEEIRITRDEGGNVYAEAVATGLPEELTPRVKVGTVKGNGIEPSQELAMSLWLRRGAFEEYEVSYEDAMLYLRGEALQLDRVAALGYVLLTYEGNPLGFVKNIGKRANNLYPDRWRVRSVVGR